MSVEEDEGPCEQIILQKAGLDLRLKEFFEQNRRIQDVHRRLMRKYDGKVVESILSFEHDLNSYAEPIRNILKEQTEKLRKGEKELDLARYQRDVLKDEAERLKAIFQQLKIKDGHDTTGFRAPNLPNPNKVTGQELENFLKMRQLDQEAPLWNADNINVRMTRLPERKPRKLREDRILQQAAEEQRIAKREARAQASIERDLKKKQLVEGLRDARFDLKKFPGDSDEDAPSMIGTASRREIAGANHLEKLRAKTPPPRPKSHSGPGVS